MVFYMRNQKIKQNRSSG